jgi:hypothetical protein
MLLRSAAHRRLATPCGSFVRHAILIEIDLREMSVRLFEVQRDLASRPAASTDAKPTHPPNDHLVLFLSPVQSLVNADFS